MPTFPFLIQITHLHTNSLEANSPASADSTLGGRGNRLLLVNRVNG